MTMGERIKECREKLNMSQEELAKKMGYVARSSITRIEKGQNDIPRSKIVEFAKALETTPEYLMGLNEKSEPEDNIENPDIRMIARAGKKMSKEQSEILRKYAEFMFPEAFK